MRRPPHKCAAFGCSRRVPWNHLMCKRCWAEVPPALQRDVYAAWNNGVRTTAWAAAVAKAIEAVAVQREMFA